MKEDKKNDDLMQYKKVSCWKFIQKNILVLINNIRTDR